MIEPGMEAIVVYRAVYIIIPLIFLVNNNNLMHHGLAFFSLKNKTAPTEAP
jgi:hypothetical protein